MKTVFFAFILYFISTQALACELTVRYEHYSPKKVSDQMQWHGMDVDFAKALLEQAGCKYRFVDMAWGRAIDLLEQGKIDMMLGVSDLEKRKQFAHFIGPHRQETIVLATLASEAFFIERLEELKKLSKPIAIQRGAYYGDEFEALLESDPYSDIHFVSIPNNDVKLYLLRNKRISGFLEERSNIIYQSKNNPEFKDIVVNPFVIHANPVYFALSQKTVNEELLNKLEAAFVALQKEQAFKKILNKYQN